MLAEPIHNEHRTQVLLVDDHPAVRYGVRRLIDEQPDLITVAEAGSAFEAASGLSRSVEVAVIDYHLGDGDGLSLALEIKRRPSPPAVLIYSAFAEITLAIAAITAGADGLLSKSALADELPIAIRRLRHGRQHFPAVPQPVSAALASGLERRDRAIFSMLLHGVAADEICSRLTIGPQYLCDRREAIVRAIAPGGECAASPSARPIRLDYERARRRARFPAA
jgi:DNA-binding NarL/FixJ family response regulator